jgi:hypothetical protein
LIANRARIRSDGGYVQAMGAAFRAGQVVGVMPVQLTQSNRASVHGFLMAWLKEVEADAYTWLSPAWSAEIPADGLPARVADILASGGVEKVPGRREIVILIVGDKDRTLSTELTVERDTSGKMLPLIAGGYVSDKATGLFHDLLLQPKVRQS